MIDLDAYFRIGDEGPRSDTPGTLRELHHLMATRSELRKRYALGSNQLSTHSLNGGSTQKQTFSCAGEMCDALSDLFKLQFDDLKGLDPVLARLTVATQ